MGETLLEVRQLVSGYGDLRVLREVSLGVRPGKATVVLGRNGVGKSTLLSTIAGLIRAESGVIRFGGLDVTTTSAPARTRLGIGFVQENKRVFKRRSVEQNLQIGGHVLPRRKIAGAIEAAYERFPVLAGKRKQPAGALSGGQQQMLAIAQALMPEPTLLMLDEPSAGLAPVIVDDVLATVSALKEAGLSILLVEQLVDKALSIADDVVVMEHGRAVRHAEASRYERDSLREIYFGAAASDGRPEVPADRDTQGRRFR